MSQEFRNTSGLKPVGRAVLIMPYEPEMKASAIYIPPTVKERTAAVEMRAVVVEVGSECWLDESRARAKAGDKVVVAKYSGWLAQGPADGKTYRMVNANDIFCLITEENPDIMTSAQEARVAA